MATATKATKASQGIRGNLPRSQGKGRAGGKPVTAHALSELVIAMISAHADAEVKQKAELKHNLMALTKLNATDHKVFRDDLNAQVKIINDLKTATGKTTMEEYFKENPKQRSKYVRFSEWDKLSEACGKGWTPNYDMPWSAIVTEARAVKDNSTASANPDLVQQLITLRNDPDMGDEERKPLEEALVKEINSALLPTPAPTTTPTTQNQSASGADTPKTLFDQCFPLMKDRPIGDIEKLMGQIAMLIAERRKMRVKQVFDGVYAEHIAKAQQASKPTGAQDGVSGETKAEHAAASGEKNPIHERKAKAHAATAK